MSYNQRGEGLYKTLKYFLALMLAASMLLAPRPFLTLSSYPGGHVFIRFAVNPSERFFVQWTHSVEQTPWREVYEIAPWGHSGMRLVETRFKSYGAGVPADTGRAGRIIDGWIVSDLDEKRGEVIYILSRKDYLLGLDSRTITLANIVPQYTSLRFSVQYLPWWFQYWN